MSHKVTSPALYLFSTISFHPHLALENGVYTWSEGCAHSSFINTSLCVGNDVCIIFTVHLAPGWNPHCSSKEKEEKEQDKSGPNCGKNITLLLCYGGRISWPAPPQHGAASRWAYHLQGRIKGYGVASLSEGGCNIFLLLCYINLFKTLCKK